MLEQRMEVQYKTQQRMQQNRALLQYFEEGNIALPEDIRQLKAAVDTEQSAENIGKAVDTLHTALLKLSGESMVAVWNRRG